MDGYGEAEAVADRRHVSLCDMAQHFCRERHSTPAIKVFAHTPPELRTFFMVPRPTALDLVWFASRNLEGKGSILVLFERVF